MNEALKKYGAYGRPVASFLDAGVKVTLSSDGKVATVAALVRYKDRPHDEPVLETTKWKLDAKGSWVLLDVAEGGGVSAAPRPSPAAAPAPTGGVSPPPGPPSQNPPQ